MAQICLPARVPSGSKQIQLQVPDWLGLPDLYQALLAVLSVQDLESDELLAKARTVASLLNTLSKDPAAAQRMKRWAAAMGCPRHRCTTHHTRITGNG